jgi:hypothetical protein
VACRAVDVPRTEDPTPSVEPGVALALKVTIFRDRRGTATATRLAVTRFAARRETGARANCGARRAGMVPWAGVGGCDGAGRSAGRSC